LKAAIFLLLFVYDFAFGLWRG